MGLGELVGSKGGLVGFGRVRGTSRACRGAWGVSGIHRGGLGGQGEELGGLERLSNPAKPPQSPDATELLQCRRLLPGLVLGVSQEPN